MELLWTAFLLGFIGSLHCGVMCGPLVMAVNGIGRGNTPALQFVYHAGRFFTYSGIGVLFGVVGKTFAFAGLQRWLSVAAGAAILLGLFLSSRWSLHSPLARFVTSLKSLFGAQLQRRTCASRFLLGGLNGLLPCGLIYIAAPAAATTLSPWTGALYMAAFGVGTLPMLLGIGAASGWLRIIALRFQRLIPICVLLVGLLLLLRGLDLGIPYLSPKWDAHSPAACH